MHLFEGVEKLRAGLDYHLQRQNLLVSNLSHLDTPGYKPLDLDRGEAFRGVLHAAMEATDPGHIGAQTRAGTANSFKVINDPYATPGLDGNAVSIDREAVKIATNHSRYETLTTLTTAQFSGLIWAANDGRGG